MQSRKGGRPSVSQDGSDSIVLAARMSVELYNEVHDFAKEKEWTIANIMRKALRLYLDKEKAKQQKAA
jgi:hypothetical protein